MQAHEVPTHVQAEDKVLLWFTFPQIVAITAVGALAYGLHRYAPIPWSEARLGLAVLFALVGLAAIVGRIGGRRLPLVAADLLQYRLGGRCYAGTPAELVRSEPPAPENGSPGLIRQMAEKTRHRLRRLRRRPRGREHRNGRRTPRLQRWLHNRRKPRDRGRNDGPHSAMRRAAPLAAAVALLALTAVAASGTPTPAPEPTPGHGTPYPQTSPERWRNEIDFDPVAPVPGRRLFVEGLTVSGERAEVVLRAATDLDLRVRAYGGPEGRSLRAYATASPDAGERSTHDMPLDGPSPSLVFSWEDELGQAGAVSLDGERLPYPLPVAAGELCSLRVTSLSWAPNALSGAVASECVSTIEEAVDLQTVAGHADLTTTALLEAEVLAVTGSVTVTSGGQQTIVTFVAGGETRFRLPVAAGEGVHAIAVEAELTASLRIALPPLVQLTHHPERTERLTETAVVSIPAYGDTVTETVSVPGEDGTSTEHSVTASCSVPASTVSQDIVFTVVHDERVEAAITQREALTRTRAETLTLASSLWADSAYVALAVPEPEPEPEPVTPVPAGSDDLRDWFEELGWEWVW